MCHWVGHAVVASAYMSPVDLQLVPQAVQRLGYVAGIGSADVLCRYYAVPCWACPQAGS
jgi:hypothetical protein